MKLRFTGKDEKRHKYVEEVVDEDGETTEVAQLTQMFEGKEYFWPAPGSVITVDPLTGGWLLGKLGKKVEELEHKPEPSTSGSPNRIVAVMPEEAKPEETKPDPKADPKPSDPKPGPGAPGGKK